MFFDLSGYGRFLARMDAKGSATNQPSQKANKRPYANRCHSHGYRLVKRRVHRRNIFVLRHPLSAGRSPLSLYAAGLPAPCFDVFAGRAQRGHAVRDSCLVTARPGDAGRIPRVLGAGLAM